MKNERELLMLFYDSDNCREVLRHPFLQDGKVCATDGHVLIRIAIYESDSPWTRKVKEFMAAYGIVDICMRMLNIGELKRIMGFPTDYVLIGTQAEQKKYIGNAVEVNMSRVLCEALCRKIKSMNQ